MGSSITNNTKVGPMNERKYIFFFCFQGRKKHIFHFRFHRFKEIGENIYFSLIFKGREFSLGNSNFFFFNSGGSR